MQEDCTMTKIRELTVRPAVEADLEPMCVIKRCPLVQKNQYWIEEASWLVFASKVIQAKEPHGTRIDVLEVTGEVVGYVITQCQVRKKSQFGYFSFNLLPELWGRGLMESALMTIFTEFFQDERSVGGTIECFSGNKQCRRLMQKLSFTPVPIPILERLFCLITRLPIRWVVRFWLNKESWSQYASLSIDTRTAQNTR